MEIIGAQKAFIPDEKEQKIRIPKSTAELAKLSAVTAPKSINGVVMNDAEYAFLSRMAAKSDDPEGVLIKGAAALTISRNTSLPVSYCLSNLDEISKAQVGTPAQSEQAWLASIVNSYKIGDLTVQRGNIGKQYANAERAGQDITELAKQMQDIDAQIESLKDYAPRTWATKALQIVAQSLPYTLNVSAVSTGAGLAAKGVTAAIPGIADDIAVGAVRWITGIAGAMKTKDVLWGSMYYDMVQDGVDKDVAYGMSQSSGLVSGVIEQLLGATIKGITKAAGVSGGSIADKLVSRMYANGTLGKVGAFFTRWIANGVEEGSEEWVESIKDKLFENLAYTLSDMEVPVGQSFLNRQGLKNNLSEAGNEFVYGALSGMILGLPADIINTGADAKAAAKEAERLKMQAGAIPSKEAYVNLNKDSSVLSYMNDSQKKQTLSDLWEKQQAAQASDVKADLNTIDIDDVEQPDSIGEEGPDGQAVEGIASSQPVKPLQRLSDGRLRTQESDSYRTNTDGSETHTLKLGSVGSSQRYGSVEYTINGNQVTIDSVKTKQGYEDIASDAVIELSRRYEGYNVSWDPETAAQQNIKASLIEANPRGKEAGLNYYDKITDTDSAIRLADGIRKTFPKLSKDESTVAAQILELVAKGQGKTTSQWMTDNFQGFQQKDLGEGRKGAVEFAETEKGARAIVYASENADFSTFTHEVFHVARRTSSQSQSLASAMQEASRTDEFKRYIKEHEQIIHMSAEEAVEALKKFSDSWTVPQEELAATLFESYLRDGATASPKLRNLFQKIADWFVRIYNKIKSTVKMDDRIVSVFDQILGGDTEVSRQFKEATQEADSINEKVDDINGKADDTLYQSEDAAQQEYDQVYEQYHGTDKWLKAPNGEDTRLTERQWVQVRTPAFIKWFGDWQNDPKNASKIVDENGEPKAMYHGSSFENITEFKNGDRGIIYLTDDPGVAQDYADGKITSQEGSGNKVYELFAKIVNPATSHDKGVIDILYKRWKQNGDTRESIIEAFDEGYDPYLLLEDPGVIQSLKKAGYDGVEFYESASMSYGVFLPAQIKSSVENTGSFDPSSPNILFQESKETRPIEKRVRGDKLLDALDLIDEVKQVGATVSDLGIITLYHATSKAAAKNIESTGMMIAKEDGLFFSTKSDGQIAGYGESVVKLEIPAELLEIDDIFDDEAHLYLGIGNKRSRNVAEFGPNILFQTVYHGSVADFAKFNMDFVGTGEGGEMFGWGVYTSESMKIAEEYAKQFGYSEENKQSDIEHYTKRVKKIEDDLAKAKEDRSNPEWVKSTADRINKAYENGRFSDRPWNQVYKGKTAEEIRDIMIANALEHPVKTLENDLERAKAQLKEIEEKEAGGKHVYTLDIPDGRYLDWDAKVPQSTLNRIAKLLKLDEYDRENLLSYYSIGSDLYGFLAKFLNSSKQASQFLNGIGFDGITYKAGRYQGLPDGVSSRTENKVVFNPGSISILENTLFQSTDPEQEIIDEAKGFEDIEDFVSYAEAMLDVDESTAREAFEKAHEVKGFGDSLSDDEKDDKFIQMMETDKGIDDFVLNIRALSYSKWQVDSGQVRRLDEPDVKYYETARRFETEASPFIQAIAKGTKDVSEESRKKIRSMLINNARMYRDLYAAIINDDTMAAVQYDEFLPNIDEPAVSGISIMDRKRMSDKIEAEGLKKKILSGTETLRGETEKVIKQLDLDISNLEDEVKAAQAETDRLKSQMSSVERDYLLGVQEKRKARQALDRTNRLIRARMDSGRRIPAESITKQRSLQDKIDLLDRQIAGWHAQNKDNAKTLRMAATEKKNQAIEDLKAEIRTKEQERREARKIRDYKQQLASAITEKPSDAVDYEYAQKINAIRSLVDPNFRAGFIRYNDKKYSIAEFREIVEKEGLLSSDLTDYQIARLTKKSLDDWTISELEEMAEKVSRLREEGRQIWQAKVDKRAFEAQALQNAILREILENKHYKAPDDISASIDYQRRRRSLKTKWKAGIGKTYNMDRKAQMVDGDKKGVAHDLLVRKKRETQENELRSMSRRQDPITKLMKDLGVSVDDLYKTVDIALDGKQYKFTYSDLVYGINAQKEERNYRAFAYGDLVSDQDKIDLFHDSVAIERLGDDRNRQFISQAKLHLANEEKLQKVFDAIEKDLQEQATRLNEVSIREYNKGIDIQDYYMPIYRKDFNGTEISQQLQDDIFNRNAGKSATTPKHGSMTSRIDISADHQMPTAMDYFGTWAKSLAQQEHIISTLEYTRELNRVFKNLGSKDLRSNITSTFGDGMMADIDQYINEVANPSVFTDVQGLNSALKMLRGGLYTGYLGFKMSSIVLQGLSSPMPFLSEVNPIQLIAGLFKMTASPAKTWNFICDQSKFMANRSMHPVIDEIKHRAETSTDSKFKRGYNKALKIGTQGLEIIDRWAVAGGWIACYEKKLAALENQNSAESMAEAARYADEVVYATQPLGDLTELSPLFKSQSEFARAFTQFQTALNVIWQNVTYDAPKQLKRHQFRKAVGIYAGYALAGVLLTAVMDGFDDDDDEMDKLRKLVFGATTQFADSFPLIGGIVENLSFALITGERPPQYVSSMFPALDKLSSGVVSLSQGDVDKALSKIGEGAALATGLPVSGLKELEAMFTDGFHPEALLGRRK